MKKLIFTTIMFLVFSNSQSQIIEDYPFKTYLDENNNLYTAGLIESNGQKDIYIQKFFNNNQLWDRVIHFPNGNDRALNIIADIDGNCFVSGYIYKNSINRKME